MSTRLDDMEMKVKQAEYDAIKNQDKLRTNDIEDAAWHRKNTSTLHQQELKHVQAHRDKIEQLQDRVIEVSIEANKVGEASAEKYREKCLKCDALESVRAIEHRAYMEQHCMILQAQAAKQTKALDKIAEALERIRIRASCH